MTGRRCSMLALMVMTACSRPPVEWQDARSVVAPAANVAMTAAGDLQADSAARIEARVTLPAAVCPGSLRLGTAGRTMYAVWWSPRPDSSAYLVASQSADGGARWGAVARVDTLDRGRTGCRRAPPAIAADSVSGYVHISYAMHAPEGPGLFFSHSMDRGAMFHSPVPILYGERLGRTSIAVEGDVVAVAFEDPNGSAARVGLALSRTMGHIFEDRVLPASLENGAASHPLVSVQGRRISLAWQERAASDRGVVFRIRTGTIH